MDRPVRLKECARALLYSNLLMLLCCLCFGPSGLMRTRLHGNTGKKEQVTPIILVSGLAGYASANHSCPFYSAGHSRLNTR